MFLERGKGGQGEGEGKRFYVLLYMIAFTNVDKTRPFWAL